MKKYLISAVVVCFALNVSCWAAGADTAPIEAKENAAWQAWKDKNADNFKKLVDKDLRSIEAEGVADLQKELGDMTHWDLKSFALSDFKAFSDEADVIVTSYHAKLEGTVDGKDVSGTYNCGSVWKKEGGKWLAIFHAASKSDMGMTAAN